MALHLTSSNRFERLLDSLLHDLAATPRSPFTPHVVIVPSIGVRRVVELAAADRWGVCAHVQFPFLAQWLWQEIAKVVPDVDESSPFAPARLAWRVFRILGEPAFVTEHAPLARYLERADARMRHELAVRVAGLFDRYITYRQDWLAQWSRGRAVESLGGGGASAHASWQAALWRRIAEELGAARQHPSVAFFKALESGGVQAAAADLPDAVHVFALPSIAPLYVDMLRELARWTDVRVYTLNPCEAYWEDIVTPRRLAELEARNLAEHFEVGNELLARWAKETRAHLHVTAERWESAAMENATYERSAARTLLGAVQRSMLELTDIAPACWADVSADRSIEVHVCHSLTRELEVLHDELLAMFAADASLRPGDVLVVTPDLEEAAPLVDAVFGTAPERRFIPYAITGRARSVQNVAARALLDVLRLVTSRFAASDFFELLDQPIVARRFSLDPAGVADVREWIQAAAIRWGVDAAHRGRFDLPALERYTFADGLDRLFLGYAVPAAAATPLGGSLGAGDVEGTGALGLGAFAQMIEALAAAQHAVHVARSAHEWRRVLQDLAVTFLAPEEAVDDVRELEHVVRALCDDMSAGAAGAPIPVEVVLAAVEAALDDPARGGVPTGGVTFAAVASLRTIPYRVVCALGFDDGAFPSAERPLEFDLIAAAPRVGDRRRAVEDRNAFLDLLLAARGRFYVSYAGRDVRDNSPKPPSVLVSELVEVLVRGLTAEPPSADGAQRSRERLVIEHPLQPFAAEAFARDGDPRRRSFNAEYAEALRRRANGTVALAAATVAGESEPAEDAVPEPARAFFASPLPEPEPAWRDATLERLMRFFDNPCRFLLTQRLGVALPQLEAELEDAEPFMPEWRGRSALATRLGPLLLAPSAAAEDVDVLARAGTEYPPGPFGEQLLRTELTRLRAFAGKVRRDLAVAPLAPGGTILELTLDGASWRLEGGFGDLRPTGLVRHAYDETRPRDYLMAWIQHLFLCAWAPDGVAARTVWHSRDGSFTLRPVADARAPLATLLRLYACGLREPLRFFPRTSFVYVFRGRAAAEDAWNSTVHHRFGDDRDAGYRLALRGIPEVLDERFEQVADAVFEPLRAALDDPRVGA